MIELDDPSPALVRPPVLHSAAGPARTWWRSESECQHLVEFIAPRFDAIGRRFDQKVDLLTGRVGVLEVALGAG